MDQKVRGDSQSAVHRTLGGSPALFLELPGVKMIIIVLTLNSLFHFLSQMFCATCKISQHTEHRSKGEDLAIFCLLLLLSRFSRVRLRGPNRRQPIKLHRPWDFPGKNTGVGCHFLLQCMKVKSENEVAQSCPTLSDLMDCSLPGSSVHGIF